MSPDDYSDGQAPHIRRAIADPMTLEETISLWSEHYNVPFTAEAGEGLAVLLRQSPEAMWSDGYLRERFARLDAEARLAGQRWAMGAVVVAMVALSLLMGCLQGANAASRAAARWEVSDGNR